MKFSRAKKISVELSIAPLVDVVLLLLIFFMLTSSFKQNEGIQIDLPQAESSSLSKPETLTIEISEKGMVHLNGQQYTISQFKEAFTGIIARKKEEAVLVKSDKEAPVEFLVQVMDALREAGRESFTIATQKSSNQQEMGKKK